MHSYFKYYFFLFLQNELLFDKSALDKTRSHLNTFDGGETLTVSKPKKKTDTNTTKMVERENEKTPKAIIKPSNVKYSGFYSGKTLINPAAKQKHHKLS